MKSKILLTIVLFNMLILEIESQVKHDYNWLFGYDYNPVKGSHIDFNKSNEIDSIELGIRAFLRGNNSNISDKDLICYYMQMVVGFLTLHIMLYKMEILIMEKPRKDFVPLRVIIQEYKIH